MLTSARFVGGFTTFPLSIDALWSSLTTNLQQIYYKTSFTSLAGSYLKNFLLHASRKKALQLAWVFVPLWKLLAPRVPGFEHNLQNCDHACLSYSHCLRMYNYNLDYLSLLRWGYPHVRHAYLFLLIKLGNWHDHQDNTLTCTYLDCLL